MRKQTICMGENKDADQLRGNREADQRLCFRYTDSTFPPLLIPKFSRFWVSSVTVQAGLCWTWSETQIVGFVMHRLISHTAHNLFVKHFELCITFSSSSDLMKFLDRMNYLLITVHKVIFILSENNQQLTNQRFSICRHKTMVFQTQYHKESKTVHGSNHLFAVKTEK